MSDALPTGPIWGGTGTPKPFTASLSGSQRSNVTHGSFFDAAYNDRLFSGGSTTLVAINNATFTVATLGATATPIIGLWNPLDSNKILSVLQASLGVVMTALAATGPGGYFWAVSRGNAGLTLGINPWSRSSLTQNGSSARFFSNVALTGLTNNLVVLGGSALGGGSAENASFTATAVAMQTQQTSYTEFIDGAILLRPGAVLALLCGTTPVAHSVSTGLLWEELPNMP